MSAFIPPTFGNFGKSANDLFKKKYDFDPVQFKSTRKAKGGIVLENGAVNTSKGLLRGYTKLALNGASWGNGEVEVHTDKDQTSKVSAKFTKLYPGLGLTLALNSKDKADLFKGASSVTSAEASYSREFVNGVATFKSDNSSKHRIESSLAGGYDNVSVGGSAVVELDGSENNTKELNFGVEYTQQDLTVSGYTSFEKGTRFFNGSLFHRVNRDLVAGGLWKLNSNTNANSLTIGSDYKIDADTGLKSKLELPSGSLSFALEYRLNNPQVLLGFASELDVSKPELPTSKQFGVSLTFGDF